MEVRVFPVACCRRIVVTRKKTPAPPGTRAAVSPLAVGVDRYVLTVPSMVQEAPTLPLGWQELLVTGGFLGLWGLAYAWFARRFPIVSPRLMDRMEAEGEGRH